MSKNKQDLMYGLDELKFNDLSLGYIAEDSFDWGGAKGESTPIRAAQKKGAPVFIIPKSNATIAPTFDLIQMNYENLQKTCGGELIASADGKVIGWKAPTNLVNVSGGFTIDTDSGHRISIPNAMLSAYMTGGLTLTDVSKLKCELGIMEPEDGSAPYDITDIPITPPPADAGA